jgi:hypothetical protein
VKILVVVTRCRLLDIRWDAGTRGRLGGGVGDAEAVGLRNRAVEGSDLLKAPGNVLARI